MSPRHILQYDYGQNIRRVLIAHVEILSATTTMSFFFTHAHVHNTARKLLPFRLGAVSVVVVVELLNKQERTHETRRGRLFIFGSVCEESERERQRERERERGDQAQGICRSPRLMCRRHKRTVRL